MEEQKTNTDQLNDIIEMISSMARLDFSNRIQLDITNEPLNVIRYGLNMLSEELETNVVKRSRLEGINANLEQFAFTAAHDMKSPLNTATGLLYLIEMELNKSENKDIREYVLLINQVLDQARKMINGILEYSRIDLHNIEMDNVDLGKLCADLVKDYALTSSASIHIAGNMPVVLHNKYALTQIMSNLLSNAIKYNDKDRCEIWIGCTDKSEYYEVSVADNGPGVAEKNRTIIFDLFENLKTETNGSTGIGLAIVKKLVTETNGKIWVDSNIKQGAKFVFTISKTA